MKRFYKLVSTEKTDSGWLINLDGKAVKTPLGAPLTGPNEAVANLMLAEWSAQEDDINPETMPITQIITTAIDRVSTERAEIERQVLAYLDTDMICYRAEQPEHYVLRQKEAWDPWLDWFENLTGDRLEVTTGLQALTQSSKNNQHVSDYIKSLDLHKFTVFQILVSISGSIVLAMAFMAEEFDTGTLFDLSHVEDLLRSEIYNEDFYGVAPTQDRKWNATKRDFKAINDILQHL
ncbi:MAG: ATP12 family protein [Bdellovibrionales bacterium]